MIKVKNLNKTYKSRKITHHALKDVSLDFEDTGLNFLLGKSGSGKTTLMNMIGGLDKFDSGDIVVKHLSLAKASNSDKDRLRNTVIGFIFQDFNLIEHMTVFENVSIALKLLGNSSKEEELKLAKKAISDVGLSELGNRKINELSGGQKQRVAIARALIKQPDILLCDEPTGNLDDNTSNSIFELLKEISRTKLVIVVSHNDKLAYHYGDRVINLLDGQVIKDELTSKGQKLITKQLEYNEEQGTKEIAKSLLGSVDNSTVISAKIKNDGNKNNSSDVSNNKKSYDMKNINMFRVLFKTGFGYFTLRKVRLVILTILMCFSLTIGTYMIGMYTYDGKDDTVKYLEQYDFPLQKLSCSRTNWRLSCDDGLYNDYLTNSDLGEDAIVYYGNEFLEYGIQIDIPNMTNDNYVSSANQIANILVNSGTNLTKYFDLAEGSTGIVNDNDIYITDRIAYQIDPSLEPGDFIGTELDSKRDTFIIKGVILTDYKDVDLNPTEWMNSQLIPYHYNIILFNKNYVDNQIKNESVYKGSSINLLVEGTYNEDEEYYSYSYLDDFARVSDHLGVDTTLLVGKRPTELNEIVVSKDYMCGLIYETTRSRECYTTNSESELESLFNEYLGTIIVNINQSYYGIETANFNAMYRDGLEIVGVMENIELMTEDGFYNDAGEIGFLLSDEGFELLQTNMAKTSDKFVLLVEDEYEYFTDYLYDATNNDIIGDGYVLQFSAWDPDTFAVISNLSNSTGFTIAVLVVTLIFTLVATVVSSFNLNFIVENKKKEIGIFKAQGYRNRQLYAIFIIIIALQTIVITSITASLSIFAMNLINEINSSFGMQYTGYDLITFDIHEFLYLFTCTFIFGALSLYKPLRKMAKTEPIDVIKNL